MQSRFAPEVEKSLRTAGWFPGRKANLKQVQIWEAMRPLFPTAKRALEEFFDLYFEAEGLGKNGAYLDELDESGNFQLNPQFRESFCIDPVAAFADYGDGETNEYENYFGCKVRFIGFRSYRLGSTSAFDKRPVTGEDHLLIDEHGRLFFVDYFYILVGETIEQALHNLITGTGLQRWDIKNNFPNTNSF